jgi:hypothetical protein
MLCSSSSTLFFEVSGALSSRQFRFQKGKSCTTAVQQVTETVMNAFEEKNNVSLTLCDLSKAFDCISPELLMRKLEFYNVSPGSLQLLKSFLSDRVQRVYINNSFSDVTKVKCGIP